MLYELAIPSSQARTIEAHNYTVTSSRNPESTPSSGQINPQALSALPKLDQRAFVTKWARQVSTGPEQSKTPSNLVEETNSLNGIQEDKHSDVASISSSTVCVSIDKDFLESWQIEAVPPYPKTTPAVNTLFDLRNQICHPVSPRNVPVQTVSPRFAEEDFMYLPFEHIEVPSMTLSSTSTDSALHGSTEELNIGKLIAGKVRQAAAHSVAAWEKLKRKLKH
ncbi:uncharacterized protein N7469_008349 [Penicillium citrinum]|uniref:Uncharacterized protein n=1 Tax=Penicillium citrinum TaxID=5077 RepID=A0A9W9NRW8_PENCI|nr:uncharacterized protein N7469_008349 [Penicillium citrinum]KAJ5224846.1 hypothetical protein N7469_008349 [Penicillium citrinum]